MNGLTSPSGSTTARLRIIHRYFLREIAGPTGIALGLYTFVLLMNQFFVVADYAYKYRVPVSSLGKLFILQFPHVIVLTLPIALLVGLLVATARLAADSELTALSASGVSIRGLLAPVLVLALGFGIVTAWFSFDLMPRGNHEITRTIFDVFRKNLLSNVKQREFNDRLVPGMSLYVREVSHDADGDHWRGVILDSQDLDSPHPRRQVFFAAEAVPSVDAEAGVMVLTLHDVRVHFHAPGNSNRYDIRTIAMYQAVLPPPPLFRKPAEAAARKTRREMTLGELIADLEVNGNESTYASRSLRVEFHKRFAIPSACVVFAFLGLGLGARARRSGRSFGFVASLAIILIYYQLFYAGERLGVNGRLPAWFSMWAGNLLFGTVGMLLFIDQTSEGRTLDRLVRRLALMDFVGVIQAWLARLPRSRSSDYGNARARRGLPTLLDRYVLTEYFRIFVWVLGSALLLYIQITFSQILNDIVRNRVPAATIAAYYIAWLPEILGYCVPVAVLITTVVTFSLLMRTNEITAMLVHGVSLRRIVLPVVAAGALLTGLVYAGLAQYGASAAKRWDELTDVILGNERSDRLGARWVEESNHRGYYHFESYDAKAGVFDRFSFYEVAADENAPRRHVFAARAKWAGAALELEQGWERKFGAIGKALPFVPFEEQSIRFVESRRDFGRDWGRPKFLSDAELDDYIRFRRRHDLPTRELEIELKSRSSMPAVSFVMLVLGLPFAFAVGKRGSLYGVGVAIVIAILYWSTIVFTAYLGKLGLLSPWLASWSPNLIFGFLGLAAFLNLRT